MMKSELRIDSFDQLNQVASVIAQSVSPADVVFLQGNLGAGKTTFCQAFFKSLGYQGLVKSPTYAMIESYSIDGQDYYHFDLYRLNDPFELYHMGVEDYFSQKGIVLVEWPLKGKGVLPQPSLILEFVLSSTGLRTLCAESSEERYIQKLIDMGRDPLFQFEKD
jgi:tRNA threonylcarbamoyladenosine biosynthesis protein TsaE